MPTTDARVDAYIEKAPEFAKPLLRDWRAQVHKTCPEVVEAKRPETRAKRLEQAMQLLTDGKRRNWKYESC